MISADVSRSGNNVESDIQFDITFPTFNGEMLDEFNNRFIAAGYLLQPGDGLPATSHEQVFGRLMVYTLVFDESLGLGVSASGWLSNNALYVRFGGENASAGGTAIVDRLTAFGITTTLQ